MKLESSINLRFITIFVVLASLSVVSLLVAFRLPRQLNLSPDSFMYLDIAKNIKAGLGVSTFNLSLSSTSIPDHVIAWPPLFPIAIALLMMAGLTNLNAAVLLSMVLLIVSVLLVFFVVHKKSNLVFAVAAALTYLYLVTKMSIWQNVWSEQLFTVLLLSVWTYILLRRNYDLKDVFVIGLMLSLVALTRYAGIVLLPVVFAVLFLRTQRGEYGSIRRLATTGVAFVLGLTPLIVWFIRNIVVSGSIFGVVSPVAFATWHQLLSDLTNAFSDGFVQHLIWLVAAVFVGGLLNIYSLTKTVRRGLTELRSSALFLFVVLYLALITYSVHRYNIDAISGRYLEPLYPLTLIALFIFLERVVNELWLRIAQLRVEVRGLVVATIFLISVFMFFGKVKLYITDTKIAANTRYRDKVSEWVINNTGKEDIIINRRSWVYRFVTDRVSISSDYPYMPQLTAENIITFLMNHSDLDGRRIMIVDISATTLPDYNEYAKFGITLLLIAQIGNNNVYELK
ncbi:hypothetical protein KC614_04810 [candidate division WWE3 bacterium]|uniref:Glycosyltransferase RgtA/B/C/D-like domain-containing protein n=1 Tax=candidate division WWE3 bacterium TaxID=2053526 RepID=A0A955RSE0_UNCKA|nr:hypothetical protein [candidate division WWE3 bacterium]